MKKGFLAELKAFTPWYMLPIRIIQSIALFLVGIYLYSFVGRHAVMFFPPLVIFSDSMLDYLAFAGISMRRQKSMEWIKSSVAGRKVAMGALMQDSLFRIVSTAAGSFGIMIGSLAIASEEYTPFVSFAPLVFIPFTYFISNISLLISHRVGGTVSVQMLLGYALMVVGEIICVFMGMFLFADDNMGFIKGVVLIAIWAVIAFFTAKLLLRDAEKGYESGFFDNEGFKIVTAEKPAISGKGE
jgi:hypothetical protein